MKNLLTFLLFVCTLSLSAQDIIQMEKVGGVYKVPCKINGLSLKFIFDTGASDVSLSLSEAVFMVKNGYLNESDFRGTETYRIANGDIAEGTKVNLRKVEFGKQKLYNVEASIVHSMDAPLLLGQSVLQRLGKFSVDYSKNILVIGTDNSKQSELIAEKPRNIKKDLDVFNLKGKVKSISKSSYKVIDNYGKLQKGGFIINYSYQFHKDGNMSAKSWYDSDGKSHESSTISILNYKGNKIKESIYDADGLISKTTYKYDESDNVIEEQMFNDEGDVLFIYIYKYDSQGNRIEQQASLPPLNYNGKTIYNYDQIGNLAEEKSYSSDGSLNKSITYKYDAYRNVIEEYSFETFNSKQTTFTYSYEYDKSRNWIKKITFFNDKPESITEQKIEYYP